MTYPTIKENRENRPLFQLLDPCPLQLSRDAYVTLRVKPLTANYHFAIFDYHWSKASGDKTY